MTNKEEKFWGAVRASEKTGRQLLIFDGPVDKEHVAGDIQRISHRFSSYGSPSRGDDAEALQDMERKPPVVCGGFSARSREAFDVLKEIGRHALLRTDLPVPEEILALVELSGGAATEWQKILRYMEDTEGNRLKMEARLHRIAAYQERGEKESFALLRFLYSGEDAVTLIYWKDAVTDLSRFLSAVNRKAELLQRLIEEA